MSLVTDRNTHIQAAGTSLLNVQDFESLGFYLVGTGSGTIIINVGTLNASGLFIGESGGTAPGVGSPLKINVEGFDWIEVTHPNAVTGSNGVYVVGNINKVSNE